MFKKNFFKNNKNIALIDASKNKTYTYGEIESFKSKFEKNFKNKSIVLLITSNSIFSILVYISLMITKKKIILLLVNEDIKEKFIKKIIRIYKPNYIIANKMHNLKRYNLKQKYEKYYLLENNSINNKNLNFINKLLIPTSGTTGNPKMVRLSLENLNENTKSIIRSLDIKKIDTTITTMPMSYSYGLSIINTFLSKKAKIVVCKDSIANKNFWKYFNQYNITNLNGVPKFYEFLNKLRFENIFKRSLRFITQAGGNLDLKYKKYLYNLSKKNKFIFYIMYGLTEASPRVSILNVNKYKNKIHSVGKPIKGVNVKINLSKKNSKEGMIEIHGKNVCLGYSEKLCDLKKSDENNSRLISGDIGFLDKDKFLYILKRKNRISKIFGLRINLDDMEEKLLKAGIKTKCLTNDKYILVNIFKISNKEKIKKMIYESFGINKNFIKISLKNNILKNKEIKL